MIVAEYKFNNSSGDLLPSFNAEFVYTYEDTVEDTTTTRIIYSDEYPTEISFMQKKNLLEVHRLITDNIDSAYGMFYQCTSLTYVNLSYSNFSKVETMEGMFNTCSKITTIDGLDTLDVSNVHNMGGAFSGCAALTGLDIGNWDVRKVSNFGATFRGCSKVPSMDLSKWRARSVQRMGGMFQSCSKITTLDLSGFDLSNILESAGPAQAFYGCTSLVSLNLSNWILSSDISLSSMFNSCNALQLVEIYDSDYITVNRIIETLLSRSADSYGEIKIRCIADKDLIDTTTAESKYWRIATNDVNNINFQNLVMKQAFVGKKPVKKMYIGRTIIYNKED